MVKPDFDDANNWNYIITDGEYLTGFYSHLDFVLENTKRKEHFNLLAAIKEPETECENINIADFEFIGYDLLDKGYGVSALSNCGGFDETFSSNDLNKVGLVDNYVWAFEIRKHLFKNNPQEKHADCWVFALWRHKTIGRKLSKKF